MIAKLIILAFFLPIIAFAGLAPIETQIVSAVKKAEDQQLALLESLVNINSGTSNIKGVITVGEKLIPEFKQLGFKIHWDYSPTPLNRAPTLIAEHSGKSGKRLLLIGHLDTVFPPSSPFKSFKREGKLAFGPGVLDDKGGDVVILYALKALAEVKALKDTQITVVLTGDEEDSGKPTSISRKPLFTLAKQSDYALDFECAITENTATIARRGISMWVLETKGKEAHSAEIFKEQVGFGAIYELSRILDSFRTELSHDSNITLNPGVMLGGTTLSFDEENSKGSVVGKENIIAKKAIASGDIRFISSNQEEELITKMKYITSKNLLETKADIRFQKGIPAMPPTPANSALLEIYSKISEDLGFGPIKPLPVNLRGAGDISHIANFVKANLAGLGPLGSNPHSAKENLDLNSLPMQTQRAAIFIYRLTRS